MRNALDGARALVIAALTVTSLISSARAETFVQLAGVKGDARAAGHEDWIEVQSFTFGVSRSGTSGGAAAASAGKPQFSELEITKLVDRSSTVLFSAATTGKRYPTLVLHVTTAAGDQKPVAYYRITLTDVVVTSYQVSGTPEDRPVETVDVTYSTIKLEYVGQSASGAPAEPVTAGYDVRANKPL